MFYIIYTNPCSMCYIIYICKPMCDIYKHTKYLQNSLLRLFKKALKMAIKCARLIYMFYFLYYVYIIILYCSIFYIICTVC